MSTKKEHVIAGGKMKSFLGLIASLFAIGVYWAMGEKPLFESGALLISDPWGIITLADLYIGFLLFIIFMFKTVPKKTYLCLWVPSLLLLGNLVSLVYIIFHHQHILNIFKGANENK